MFRVGLGIMHALQPAMIEMVGTGITMLAYQCIQCKVIVVVVASQKSEITLVSFFRFFVFSFHVGFSFYSGHGRHNGLFSQTM